MFTTPRLCAAAILIAAAVPASAADLPWDLLRPMLERGEGITSPPLFGPSAITPADYGAESNPTGDPIGGGPGYSRIPASADFTVASREQLLEALGQAQSGQVVMVRPAAAIDLTSLTRIAIPDGVTLAGNRGQQGAPGPLLFTTTMGMRPGDGLFRTGAGVRVTGLRIRGPDPDYADYTTATRQTAYDLSARAIITGPRNEIDNCEISNFYRDGISNMHPGLRVHHCFIHNIAAYPVVLGGDPGASMLVEACVIHWGWHATAGTGEHGTGYEARYNIFRPHDVPAALGGAASHCLDQHADRPALRNTGLALAGDWLKWHHNTIYLQEWKAASEGRAGASPANGLGMKVRGNPQSLADIHHNWFPTTTDVERALGTYGGKGEQARGNVWVHDNAYGPDKQLLAEVVSRTTPQIILKSPPPPAATPHKVSGALAVEIEVNTLPGLELGGVAVRLDEDLIFLEPRAPRAGEVVIDIPDTAGPHKLAIHAVDTRGALGTHTVMLTR